MQIIIFDPYEGEGNPPDVESYALKRQFDAGALRPGTVKVPPGFNEFCGLRPLPPAQPHRIIQCFTADETPPPDWWQDWEQEE